ncbi:hypothetical protein ILUMI_15488 [Ignelater luminosus]|uniref:Uncharacterized protein n=1 Tax=Ignelater luminosus TaxID=2038154 RepID=A0A8K0G3U1_IGNLU|nr:hypothetical protein ILUMI_15488 [Ignelater luminosus]
MLIFKYVVFCTSIFFTGTRTSWALNKHSDAQTSDLIRKFHQNDYKMEFERLEVVDFNKQHMKRLEIVTFKYNCTCTVINATWMFNTDVGYDYNVVTQAYKFASNEYRLFPLRLQLNGCEAFCENVGGLKRLTCGNLTGCPILKNKLQTICNWSPDPARFLPFIPDGKYMLELQGFFQTSELYRLRFYASVYCAIGIN